MLVILSFLRHYSLSYFQPNCCRPQLYVPPGWWVKYKSGFVTSIVIFEIDEVLSSVRCSCMLWVCLVVSRCTICLCLFELVSQNPSVSLIIVPNLPQAVLPCPKTTNTNHKQYYLCHFFINILCYNLGIYYDRQFYNINLLFIIFCIIYETFLVVGNYSTQHCIMTLYIVGQSVKFLNIELRDSVH